MKKNLSLWMLGIAAMLASCSQNEELLQGTNDNNGTATFTVTLNEGMKTRAVGDDDNTGLSLTAYVIDGTDNTVVKTAEGTRGEATEEGNIPYTFTVSGLPTDNTYRIVCWAYNEEDYTADATTNFTLTAADGNPGIAYYGNTGTEAQKIADMDKNIPMTHAVGKVTLVTTKSLEAGRSAKLSVPTYKAFNLLDGTVVATDATTTATATSEVGVQVEENAEGATLCSVYVLCGSEVTNGVTVTTLDNGVENGASAKTIDNVPVKPNVHVILKGDANLGIGGNVDFTAEIATKWNEGATGDLDEYGFDAHVVEGTNTIKTLREGQIAENPELIGQAINALQTQNEVGTETGKKLAVDGPMNNDDITAIKTYLKDNPVTGLDLNLANAGITALPNNNEYLLPDYREWPGVKSIVLPEGLTTIGDFAFQKCPDLASITLPSTLKYIGFGAFAHCAGLTEVSLPASLEEFNMCAFYGCSGLTSIDLSHTQVGIISNGAFQNCTGLEEVILCSSVKTLDYYSFSGCTSLKTIDLSLCDEIPGRGWNSDSNYAFKDVDKTDITVYVKDAALKTAFEESFWVTHEGFTADNCKVKE